MSPPGAMNSLTEDVNGAVAPDIKTNTRGQFKVYFQSALKEFGTTETGMILKKDETEEIRITREDRDEISSWLDASITDLPLSSVIEIGAGIGRLTPMLQSKASHLIAVDFLSEYISVNAKVNYDAVTRPKDQFICADATQLQYNNCCFDLVFWNWLLMYLGDDEVRLFVQKALRWVKIGGFLFCRESCGEPSDKTVSRNWAPEGNPTKYREHNFYTELFENLARELGVKTEIIFKERTVSAYVTKTGTTGQRSWLIQRIS